jgi:hypothetical protein
MNITAAVLIHDFIESVNAVGVDLPDHCKGCGHHVGSHSEVDEDGNEQWEYNEAAGGNLAVLIRCLHPDCDCKRYRG